MSLQEEVIRAQVDQFGRDGYLIVPDVLSSEKVDRLNAAIDEVLAEEEPSVAHNIYHCIDRHPELRDMYFGNYTRVVLLSQSDDPVVLDAAEAAADRLGLELVHVPTGLDHFAEPIRVALGSGVA